MRLSLVLPMLLLPACGLSTGGTGAPSGTTGSPGTGGSAASTSSTGGQQPTSSTTGSGGSGGTTSSSGGGGTTTGSGGTGGGPLDWAEAGFGYRVKITLAVGGLNEDLPKFPAPLTIDAAPILSKIQPDGRDIRFTDAAGVELPHEIETWSAAGPNAVWVQVPSLAASPATTVVWLYFGDAGAADAQQPAQVWDDGFKAVYHLSDAPASGTGPIRDSIGLHPATTTSTSANGRVGAAVHIKNGSIVTVPDSNDGDLDAWDNEQRTFELWFKTGSGGTLANLLSKTTACAGWSFTIQDQPANKGCVTANLLYGCGSTQIAALPTAGTDYGDAAWHHAALVLDRTASEQMRLYLDGAMVKQTTLGAGDGGSNTDLLFGGAGIDAAIDEVRLSKVVRSDAWIRASRACTGSNFATFGAVEPF